MFGVFDKDGGMGDGGPDGDQSRSKGGGLLRKPKAGSGTRRNPPEFDSLSHPSPFGLHDFKGGYGANDCQLLEL